MKKVIGIILILIMLLSTAACAAGSPATAAAASPVQSAGATANKAATGSTTTTTSSTTKSTSSTTAAGTTTAASAGTSAKTIAEALAANQKSHALEADYTYQASAVIPITLNGTSITASGSGVSVSGSKLTISAAGTYSLSGTLSDGQIIVNTGDKDTVRLILNGATLSSSTSAPIYIQNAGKTVIILADNTKNVVTDAKKYVYASAQETEPNAAIFSKSDLTIYGSGALTVNANYADAIASKDGLVIASGSLTINAADDGLNGKDYVIVQDGSITIKATGDGIKSDNAEDAARGYILVEKGTLAITAGGDALDAATDLLIKDGKFTLATGGGSSAKLVADVSAKGLKGTVSVVVEGGAFTIDSADDGLHSNNTITVNNGTFTISAGDDALHADLALLINNGSINVKKSYEGLESQVITINNGTIHVVSSDDGINGAGGEASAAPMGRPGQATTAMAKYFLYMNGGYVYVDGNGDGVDVNGSIEMTGGTLLVNGPVANNNGAIDYDVTFKMTGGTLVAAGSSGMAMAPSSTSTVYSALINFSSVQQAGTIVRVQTSAGEEVVTFAPTKQYQSLVVASPKLVKGGSYTVLLGGKSTGTLADSLYQGGTYSGGTQNSTFTVSSVVTSVGAAQGGPGGKRP